MKNLKDRVAIVTGGARGIGFAICKELRKEGASVILADSGTSIDGTGSEPGLASDAAEVIGAVPFSDKLDGDSAKHLVDLAIKNFGSIDIVVNNAAIIRDAFIFKSGTEDFKKVLETNLVVPHAVLIESTKYMRDQAKKGRAPGRIVNMVSSAGLIGNYGQSAYAASKGGLFGISRVVALDMARSGVFCNAVAPFAATRVTESIQPANQEQEKYKAAALNIPAHFVARVVAFLASNKHEISGQLFGVRGRELFLFSQPRPIMRELLPSREDMSFDALVKRFDNMDGNLTDLKTDLENFNNEPLVR